MAALFAGAGMADMMNAGNNPAATPELKAGLYKRSAEMPLKMPTIAGGGNDTKLPESYYRRQANEDADQIDAKWQMWKKRNLYPAGDALGAITPNDRVREGFRDVRNPKSWF